jgi:SAM-dependent methyltransferase
MVDIACGKGRHSKFLAAKGFDVTGIDISTDSIQYAKQFETDNLHFFVHDMRLLFWINYFDYALISLLHLAILVPGANMMMPCEPLPAALNLREPLLLIT